MIHKHLLLLIKKRVLFIGLMYLLGLFCCDKASAQVIMNQADTRYALGDYCKAIELYKIAYGKKKTSRAARGLAKSYHMVNQPDSAEGWFTISLAGQRVKADALLAYANILRENQKFVQAKEIYQSILKISGKKYFLQVSPYMKSCDSAIFWMQHPSCTIAPVKEINTKSSEWGALKLKQGTLFVSDRNIDSTDSSIPFMKYSWAILPDNSKCGGERNGYTHLLLQRTGSASPVKLNLNVKQGSMLGLASLTEDERTLYFTIKRSPLAIPFGKGRAASIHNEIFYSNADKNGNWSEPVAFGYNNVFEYSLGDPFISADGQTLYFVSDMPGGKGGTDIYRCTKDINGSWSKPVNLTELNTPGAERSPFLTADGTLYFSSDGRTGMGGLDVFSAIKSPEGYLVKNLGYPINSPKDDFAFAIRNETTYFTSNRFGGVGSDDLYVVETDRQIR